MVMGVIGWIVLGFIASYMASMLLNTRGEGVPFDILLGIVGAVIGGWIFIAVGPGNGTGFNAWSYLVAVVAAVAVPIVWHIIRRSTSRA
jgi:uncharacterized membrane protein YeaQ/YmgE (transglycosylase-associated protein family)